MPRSAVITGLGFITSIGNDHATVRRGLPRGPHGLEAVEFLGNPSLPVKVLGTIKGFKADTPNSARLDLPGSL